MISSFSNNRGLTLVEIMIGLGIMGVVIVVSSTQLLTFTKMLAKAERKQEALMLAHQFENLMNVARNCTISLKGVTVDPAADTPINEVHYAVEDPTAPGAYIKPAQPAFTSLDPVLKTMGNAEVTAMNLKVIQQISQAPRRFLSEVKLTLVDKIDRDKPEYHFPPVTVLLTTSAAGVVEYCTTIEGSGNALKEKLCELSSRGEQIYNPLTGECRPRIIGQMYNDGNPFQARCPPGMFLTSDNAKDSCDNQEPPDFDDPFAETPRAFNDGVLIAKPPYAKYDILGNNQCTCAYASDIDVAVQNTFVCEAECYDPNAPGILDL